MIDSKEPNRKTALFLASIFILAFITRLIFAISLPPNAIWHDETGYLNIGINLCNGEGYTNEGIKKREQAFFAKDNLNLKNSFAFAPGPSFVLGFFECTVGHNVKIFRIIQSFLSSFIPICVFLLSIRLFDSKKIAYIAAIITVGYPYYIYISPLFIPQTIFSVLLVLSLYFFVSWLKEGQIIWLIMTGLVNGIACLFVAPMIFTLIPICVIILCRSGLRVILFTNLITFMTFWAFTAGAYMTYASLKNQQFILITKAGDNSLLTYNYPDISAYEVISHSLTYSGKKEIKRLYLELKKTSGKESVSAEFLKRIIIERPLFFIRNCLLRVIALFSPITFTMNKDNYPIYLAHSIGILIYFPLLLLSIAGLISMTFRRNWMGLQLFSLLAFFLIPYILIIGNTRYRLPWDSMIIIFAIYFIVNRYSNIFDRLFKKKFERQISKC